MGTGEQFTDADGAGHDFVEAWCGWRFAKRFRAARLGERRGRLRVPRCSARQAGEVRDVQGRSPECFGTVRGVGAQCPRTCAAGFFGPTPLRSPSDHLSRGW